MSVEFSKPIDFTADNKVSGKPKESKLTGASLEVVINFVFSYGGIG